MPKHTAFKKDFRLNADIFDLYDQMLSDTNISIPDVLHRVTEVLSETLHAERATIYLIDKTTDELESAAFIGNVSTTIRIPITHDSLAGFCAVGQRAFVVPDAYGDLSAISIREFILIERGMTSTGSGLVTSCARRRVSKTGLSALSRS